MVQATTVPEPEWDAHSRAIVLAYLDWKAELHSCGRPMSESMHRHGRPDPDYVIGETQCLACKALDTYVRRHHKKDGVPPETSLQVYLRAEARALYEAQTARR